MKRLLSLCAGIGVIDYVWSYILGQEIAGQVEINDFCQAVLAKRFPDVPRVSDLKVITEDDYARFGTVDVVAGGIPCQPFSDAGKRCGTNDDRHLWPYAFAIVQRKHPTWVLIENVTGFVSMALDLVQTDLESEGYESQAYVLPACAVGAPHIRERVFILAYLPGQRSGTRRPQSEGQQWTTNTYSNGAPETLANAMCTGRQEYDVVAISSAQSHATRRNLAPGSVADTTSSRLQECQGPGRIHDESDTSSWRQSQSRLGRESHGDADWLDRSQWPAGPGELQYDWEPPRTVTGRHLNRAKRLKALGNAIVPQQIYPFLKFIADWQEV